MATLSDPQIVHLASQISAKKMELIAVSSLGLSEIQVENMRHEHGDNVKFNSQVLFTWKHMNYEVADQPKVSTCVAIIFCRCDGNCNCAR